MHGGGAPLPRVVIVGGGVGGLQAARSLQRAPIRSVRRRQRNAEVLLGEATGVDTERRELHVRDRAGAHDVAVPHEYLVVATGAMGSYFGHDAWASCARARTSKGRMASRLAAALGWLASRAALHPTQFPAPSGHHYNGWPACCRRMKT
jgi:NADH dehydrogenase FAD-containing subunit